MSLKDITSNLRAPINTRVADKPTVRRPKQPGLLFCGAGTLAVLHCTLRKYTVRLLGVRRMSYGSAAVQAPCHGCTQQEARVAQPLPAGQGALERVAQGDGGRAGGDQPLGKG